MYKNKLEDSHEIAQYIEDHASEEVDFELIEENYRGCSATLKEVLVADLVVGHPDVNAMDKSKQRKYDKMSPETCPPIVVDGNKVIDGNHRLCSFLKKKIKSIMAYIIEHDEE